MWPKKRKREVSLLFFSSCAVAAVNSVCLKRDSRESEVHTANSFLLASQHTPLPLSVLLSTALRPATCFLLPQSPADFGPSRTQASSPSTEREHRDHRCSVMSADEAFNVLSVLSQARRKLRNTTSLHRQVLLEQLLDKWAWLDDTSSDEEDDAPPVAAVCGSASDTANGDALPNQAGSQSALSYVAGDEPGPSKRARLDGTTDGPDDGSAGLESRPGSSGLQGSGTLAAEDDDAYPVRAAPFPDWEDLSDEPVQDPDLSFLDL